MKKIILPFLAFALFSLTGCNSDDDDNNSGTGLHDTWTLVSAGGGFSGQTYTYEKSVIIASFKDNGDVIIVNNNIDDSKPGFFITGSYDYSIANNTTQMITCTQNMTIENATFYCYDINENDELLLDNTAVDGLQFKFVRN